MKTNFVNWKLSTSWRIVICLEIVFCFLEFSPPIYALSWQDFFPPISLEDTSRKPPGPAIAPEVVGGLDAYSNTLENQVKCVKIYQVKEFWEPKQEVVGKDQYGNPIKEFVSQIAKDLEKDFDPDRRLTNNGPRNFQGFFAKGEAKPDIESIQANFKDMNISGMGAFTRMNSISTLNIERSRYLNDVAKSLNTIEPFADVVAQDVQLGWNCQGTFVELSKKNSNCREIHVSELLYALQDLPLYYSDTDPTAPPTTFPPESLDIINRYYQGKNLSILPLETYQLIYDQLSAPKGNVNVRIHYTNYNKYDMGSGKAYDPVVEHKDITCPGCATLASPQAQTMGFLSSVNAPALPNTSDQDYCDNVAIKEPAGQDQTQLASILFFLNGIFAYLAPGESHVQQQGFEVIIRNPTGLPGGSKVTTKAELGLIPASNIEANKYLDEKFTSTTKKNAQLGIVNPHNQGDKVHNAFANFLRPASWQNL